MKSSFGANPPSPILALNDSGTSPKSSSITSTQKRKRTIMVEIYLSDSAAEIHDIDDNNTNDELRHDLVITEPSKTKKWMDTEEDDSGTGCSKLFTEETPKYLGKGKGKGKNSGKVPPKEQQQPMSSDYEPRSKRACSKLSGNNEKKRKCPTRTSTDPNNNKNNLSVRRRILYSEESLAKGEKKKKTTTHYMSPKHSKEAVVCQKKNETGGCGSSSELFWSGNDLPWSCGGVKASTSAGSPVEKYAYVTMNEVFLISTEIIFFFQACPDTLVESSLLV